MLICVPMFEKEHRGNALIADSLSRRQNSIARNTIEDHHRRRIRDQAWLEFQSDQRGNDKAEIAYLVHGPPATGL